MNEHDKNFIKNMSPLLIAGLVMLLMMIAYELGKDDIVGYSEHGVPIYESELEN